MTQPYPSQTPELSSPEDAALVSFLRQYRPVPPTAPPEAEAQLMAEIAQMPHPRPIHPGRWLGRHWKLTGAAILAGASIGLGLGLTPQWQQARSPQLDNTPAAELAELETFLENSWEGTLAQSSVTGLDWSAIGWDDTTLDDATLDDATLDTEETAPTHNPEQS
jgi:hypothetical protein